MSSSSLWVCVLALGGLVRPAAGITTDSASNPYQVIVDRNPFDLRAAPTNTIAPPTNPPPTPIWLSGIATFGKKQAFLEVQEPARPPEPAKKVFLTLTEGERQGQIEVLEIDPVAGIVKVNNSGAITNLNFKDNAPKLAAGPPAAMPQPGIPGIRPPGVPPPTALPMAAPAAGVPGAMGPGTFSFGGGSKMPVTRPIRTVPTSGGVMTGGGVPAVAGMPVVGGAPTAAQTAPQPTLSPEAAIILMEVERERTKDAVKQGHLPPLPPTELTPPSETPPVAPPTPPGPPMPR